MSRPKSLLRPLALLGVAFGASTTIADPDMWGHVRFGLDILQSGLSPSATDPYSFTADRSFVYHEWLGGVAMAAAYSAVGPAGLMALKAVLAVAVSGFVWYALRRRRFAWRWAGVNLVAWGSLPLVVSLRPQLWTALGVGIVAYLLTQATTRWLWFLPILFALWANLHGGWLVGGGILAIWTAIAWYERRPERWRLLLAGVASLVATLVTPHGVELWAFLMETVRPSREEVIEWRPIWRTGIGFVALWGLTVLTILVSAWRKRRASLATLVTLGVLSIISARVTRLIPLFIVTSVVLLAPLWPAEEDASSPKKPTPQMVLDVIGVAVFIVMALSMRVIPRCLSLDYDLAPDTVAAEALRGSRGRLVTHFNYGEYALWHFSPSLQVSIDGRRETVYSQKVLEEQIAIALGTDQGLIALARIKPEYVWLPSSSSATAAWLRAHDYREDVRTDRSFIASRQDLPPLTPWNGVSSGCFPGP